MGGLVGGLYATGMSPEELRNLVQQQNWDVIIGGRTQYQNLSFRRKEDLRAYPNSLVVGLKNGLTLPAGLNAGQEISLLIDRETLPYSRLASFDQLPIPFRCVATDLVSGQQVVFSQGSLARAMRATMSIPGLFAPVRDGDKVYVDGGLLRNLPSDVVRKMGADVVIAVHLETAPVKPEDIQSLFTVLGRSVDVVVHENEIRALAGADLIVNVNLRDFNSLDYPKSKLIIEKGENAAQEKARILAPYSLDDAGWLAYLQARNARKFSLVPAPQFVRVEGAGAEAKKQLERLFQPLVNKPLDTKSLEKLLNRLTAAGRYDSAGYHIAEENGRPGLVVSVREKSYAPPSLQFAFAMDGTESDNVNITLASRLTFCLAIPTESPASSTARSRLRASGSSRPMPTRPTRRSTSIGRATRSPTIAFRAPTSAWTLATGSAALPKCARGTRWVFSMHACVSAHRSLLPWRGARATSNSTFCSITPTIPCSLAGDSAPKRRSAGSSQARVQPSSFPRCS